MKTKITVIAAIILGFISGNLSAQSCPSSITATFTGIIFDGSPYGYNQNVNQSITLPLDRKNSRPTYCDYHTAPNHFPIPSTSLSIARVSGLWNVYYNLWYNTTGGITAVPIFQGNNSPNLIIFNTGYPQNGGVCIISTQ